MFFRHQKKAEKKRAHSGSSFCALAHQIAKGPIPIQRVGSQRIRASEPPCMCESELSDVLVRSRSELIVLCTLCVHSSESRQSIPLGLGLLEGCLGTWDIPELLAVSGSQKFFLLVEGIHLVLQVLNLRQELIRCRGFILLLRIKPICPQLSSSLRLFTANSQCFFNFKAICGVTFLTKSALHDSNIIRFSL